MYHKYISEYDSRMCMVEHRTITVVIEMCVDVDFISSHNPVAIIRICEIVALLSKSRIFDPLPVHQLLLETPDNALLKFDMVPFKCLWHKDFCIMFWTRFPNITISKWEASIASCNQLNRERKTQ